MFESSSNMNLSICNNAASTSQRTRTVHEKHDIPSQDLSWATRKARAMKEYHERSTWSCVCVCERDCLTWAWLFDGSGSDGTCGSWIVRSKVKWRDRTMRRLWSRSNQGRSMWRSRKSREKEWHVFSKSSLSRILLFTCCSKNHAQYFPCCDFLRSHDHTNCSCHDWLCRLPRGSDRRAREFLAHDETQLINENKESA